MPSDISARTPKSPDSKAWEKSPPMSYKAFIGEDIRLDPVTLRKEDSVKELLEFYMGKNTMERQNFIIKNLIVDDEDL